MRRGATGLPQPRLARTAGFGQAGDVVVGGGAEAALGDRVRAAVGDVPAGTRDQQAVVAGTGRPITMSAAVGKHSTHASLIR
jgi:hypothetical protein